MLLAIAYVLLGLVGHDPWKQDETYVTSIIDHLRHTEDWIVPRSAGLPFLEKPPLYFLVAEASADVFSPWLEVHDGARLANALWMVIVFGCLGLAARRAWPRSSEPAAGAVVALIASIGLVLQAHLLVVDVALLAGFAVALLGFCAICDRPVIGGVLLGTGTGIGFLAKGLLAPGCLGLTALVLPALFAPWRTRVYVLGLTAATIASLPWIVVWPVALYVRAPDLFEYWLWQENLGRFFGYAHLGADAEPWYYAKTVPWFTFPAMPLALWALWRRRGNWRSEPALQVCLVLTVVILAALSNAGSMRALYLLPVLLPLSLLASSELESIPPRIKCVSLIAAYVVCGVIALVLWGACLVIAFNGSPPEWLPIDQLLPTSVVPRASPLAVTFAVVATLAWLGATVWMLRTSLSVVLGWAGGLTLVWVLAATLWMPWVNAAKSYRSMFEDMRLSLPASFDCVNSIHLGESEAAMLDYEGGILAIPLEKSPGSRCELVWVQDTQMDPDLAPNPTWRLLWSGHRPGDTKERHRLFAR